MYKGTKVLDVHSHIHDRSVPRRQGTPFLNVIMGSGGMAAGNGIPSPIGPGKHSDAAGNRDEDFKAAADSLAKYITERNIDTQVLTPHPLNIHGWLGAERPELFKSWIRYSNDMVFKMVQAQPTRFVGVCQIPQLAQEKDLSHCLEEVERCYHEYAFAAVSISPDITGKHDTPGMNTAYWYPLYKKCQELNMPIIVHGTSGGNEMDLPYRSYQADEARANLHNPYYQHLFMSQQSMALISLRHNDQFEKFPGLKIVIGHCGGFVDRLIGSSDFVDADRVKTMRENLFYDTCSYDMDFLATAIKQRGVSQFCFGAEAPGSGTMNRPGTKYTADDLVPMFAEHPTLQFLSEKDKQDIFYNNPAKVCPRLVDAAATNARARVKAYETAGTSQGARG